jgi:hypothetical protein
VSRLKFQREGSISKMLISAIQQKKRLKF